MMALMVVTGLTSLNSINNLNTELVTATTTSARRITLMGLIDAASSDMLAGMRGMVLFTFAKEPAKVETCRKQFQDAADLWQSSLNELRPLLIRQEARQIADQLQSELTEWRGVIGEVDKGGSHGDPDDAMRIEVAKGMPLFAANTRDTARFSQLQDENLANQRAVGASIYSSSRWTAFAGLLLSLLTGVIIQLVVRHTNRTLQFAAAELSQTSGQVASAAGQIFVFQPGSSPGRVRTGGHRGRDLRLE